MLGLAVLEGIANLNRMVWKVLLLALLFRLLSDGRSYDVGKAKARCKQFVVRKASMFFHADVQMVSHRWKTST
jgi:hypothetical protein